MSRADAVAATSGPQHIQAMSLAAVSRFVFLARSIVTPSTDFHASYPILPQPMYASYNLERYVLRKAKGETGLTVEPWRGGEVSFGQEV